MNWEAFERDTEGVAEALRRGEFDYVEVVGAVEETRFFQMLLGQNALQALAATYPTPRRKEEVPLWLYLASELTQLEHDLAQKVGEQLEARAQLNASDLATYDQLRRRKGGVVVAEMENNSLCGSCKVRVPAHVLQQLSQAEHTTRCPNCERILVRV